MFDLERFKAANEPLPMTRYFDNTNLQELESVSVVRRTTWMPLGNGTPEASRASEAT